MVKTRYWAKTLLELDTETGLIKIIQAFSQPAAGYTAGKKKKEQFKGASQSGELVL